jgi:drug/metabolite transporter (DMT)-like permease
VFGVLYAFTFASYLIINRHIYLTYNVDALKYTITFIMWGGVFGLLSILASPARSNLKKLDRQTAGIFVNALTGSIGAGMVVYGQRFTSAINASLLSTSAIITTILFSWIMLRESFPRRKQLSLLVMFVGLYLAIVGTQQINLSKGDLIILGSAIIYGFGNTFAKILMKSGGSSYIADLRIFLGGVIFVIFGLLAVGSDFMVTSAGLWPALAGFLLWATVRCFYTAIHLTNPNEAIILNNSHPVFTTIFGVLLLSEPYSFIKFVGSLLILLGIYLVNQKPSSRASHPGR